MLTMAILANNLLRMFRPLPIFVGLLLLISCKEQKHRRIVPENRQANLEIELQNFYRDLNAVSADVNPAAIQHLEQKYSSFLYFFTKRIINIGDTANPQFYFLLKDFLNDTYVKSVNDEIDKLPLNAQQLQQDFSEAFSNYAYFFPQRKIPVVYLINSGFNYQIIALDSILAISLEYYLGEKCRFYPLLGFPQYKIRNFRPEYLLSDALKGWIRTEFENADNEKDLLSMMVFHGKTMYALEQILPDVNDSLKWGFTGSQMEWCRQSEPAIWKYLIDQKLLFTSQYTEINKYVNEAPFTPGMPRESPGQAVNYVGLQMVNNFMKKHPEVSVDSLFKIKDAHALLRQSGYKPI
jgi:hypothetical protein